MAATLQTQNLTNKKFGLSNCVYLNPADYVVLKTGSPWLKDNDTEKMLVQFGGDKIMMAK